MSASERERERERERAIKLMAYADGELEAADLEEVEGWLSEDPRAMDFANDVAHLGDLVTTGFSASEDAKAIAAFDIVDAVMAKAKAEGERERPTEAEAAVVSLAAARARKHNSYRVVGGVIAAMALAASVFMVARPKDEEPLAGRSPVAVAVAVAVATGEPASSSSGSGSENGPNGVGVEINVAETAERSASVVYLPSENSLTTSVVLWVDETGDKK